MYVINDQVTLLCAPEGPLGPYLCKFATFISEQGYAQKTIQNYVFLAACFSRWLKTQDVKRHQIVSDHSLRYLRYRAQQRKPHRGDHAAPGHLLAFLRDEGVVAAEKESVRQLTSVQRCVLAYEQYLHEVRGLAQATLDNYVPVVRNFLEGRFGSAAVKLSHLSARDVVGFVQRQAPRLHRKRAKLMTTALRSFLQYTRYCGETTLDLAAAVPTVPNWSMPSIPRAISTDQVCQLLASIDQDTARGRRDYAILMLLARLGLRLSEVTFLELDDIDWKASTLNVRGKGGIRHAFPLPHKVGEAIATYLQDGRPACASRRVFLRVRAPIQGFRSVTGVSSIVRHSLKRCGIHAPTYGAHQFRHGLATEMLRQGASLGEIGDVLGHRNPQTTTIYTKVDLDALRTLALPWPGGV